MQEKIFSLIDMLVKMSGTNNNYETLDAELATIHTEIPRIKQEIEELTSEMTDDKYFDASSEIVDRNIEISVTKRIARFEKEMINLQRQIKESSKKEKDFLDASDSIKAKITRANRQADLINKRIESAKKADTKDLYKSLFTEERAKVDEFERELKEKAESAVLYANEVKELSEKIYNINKKIEQENIRLLEVRNNLASKEAYIDQDLKRADERHLDDLKEKLSELELKEKELAKDPVILSNEIKEALLSDNAEEATKLLNEFVNILKNISYMDIDDSDALNAELTKLEAAQKELLVLIENKKYLGEDAKLIDERIIYLKDINADLEEEIERVMIEVTNIDSNKVVSTIAKLKEAEEVASNLQKSIDEYYELINDKNKKSNSIIASLQASFTKKSSELDTINEIIERYEDEIASYVDKSSNLENVKIIEIKTIIEKNNCEIKELEKTKLLNSKTKDVIEQEKDKKELKDVTDNIAAIKHRLSFDKTPQSIYDEIEMMMASKSADEPQLPIETDIIEPAEAIKTPVIENEAPVVDVIEPSNIDVATNEQMATAPAVVSSEDLVFPEFNEPPKHAATEESPIEISNKTDDDQTKEYTLSELEDGDYMSVDDYLKKMDEKSE